MKKYIQPKVKVTEIEFHSLIAASMGVDSTPGDGLNGNAPGMRRLPGFGTPSFGNPFAGNPFSGFGNPFTGEE